MKPFLSLATCFLLSLCLLACQTHELQAVTVTATIFDENGKPTAARVRFTNPDGTYFAPNGHRADFNITSAATPVGEETDVVMDEDRRFAYVEGTFTIELPPEPVRIEVVKGFRFRIHDDTFDPEKTSDVLQIHLEKAFELPDAGWWSGSIGRG